MHAYVTSMLAASLAVSLISILLPEGGIAKHTKLITALFLICILVSPIKSLTGTLRALANGEHSLPEWSIPNREETENEMQSALDSASKTYFTQSLTQMLEKNFSIPAGEIRCSVQWEETDKEARPVHVTVILSGSAIWKNAREIEAYVEELLGCECATAIE